MEYKETIIITDDMVKQFSKITGDKNPIHLDDEYSSKTIFKRRIAHGMLVSSFFSRLISETYPGEGSIYLSQTLQFIKPCYINDSITYNITLLKNENDKYFLKTEAFNQNNEIIITGDALIIKKKI
jgi:3-hydroxybutyryl-CoA dehydratase